MNRQHINLVAVVGLIVISFLCGCQPSGQAPRAGKPAWAGAISIYQAAERLGLTVQKQDYPYIEISGSNNRVLLFLYERGRVYVNGTPVAPVGKIEQIGGTYYISELLVPKIRAAMIPATAIAPTPGISPPTVPTPFKSGTILVDPGHGGRDAGTTSVMGTPEKLVNLQIAHRLADMLRQAGYNIVMTRDNDTYMDKYDRAAFANRVNPDLFVSIHCDWNDSSRHRGATVYIARQPSWTSKKIGRQLESTLSSAGIVSKGLQNADFVVLVETQCPAVLVECGFMSNYDDAKNLTSSWYQGKVAKAIADGILQSL